MKSWCCDYISRDLSQSRIVMEFDMNTIQHLGISMYARLPPVLAELVANCWDTDASEEIIELSDQDPVNKKITLTGNGFGMSLEEINLRLLKIRRNRRVAEDTDMTPDGRKVIGNKSYIQRLMSKSHEKYPCIVINYKIS